MFSHCNTSFVFSIEKIKLSPFVLTVHKGFKSKVLWTAAATIRRVAAVRSRFSDRMEQFLRLFNSGLQLSESENQEVVISDTVTERLRVSKFFLVGKVLTHKYLRPNIVMGVIKDLWRPKASVEATTIGDNCILFSFNSEEEVHLVLKGSLWFFGKSLLLLAKVNKLQVPVDVPLREQCFWVRIHGLPPALYVEKDGGCYWSSLGLMREG